MIVDPRYLFSLLNFLFLPSAGRDLSLIFNKLKGVAGRDLSLIFNKLKFLEPEICLRFQNPWSEDSLRENIGFAIERDTKCRGGS